jgi:hypothetical protein
MQTIILDRPKFAIVPQGADSIWERDAEFFESEEKAYDAAYDWSADLGGQTVNVCRINHQGTWDVITQVWA